MKIRTIGQLSDLLSDELRWRRKELAVISSLIKSAKSREDKEVLIRSGMTLLYAHWEGFIKSAASAYLEFVAMQRLLYQELAANFIALGMKGKLEEARKTYKASMYNEVAEFFLTGLTERARIPYKDAVDTKSNLSSEVFKEILIMLNFDDSHYAHKEDIIDKKLLHNRNTIAHGQHLVIDVAEYFALAADVMALMTLFNNQVVNAALTKAYLR